jgi:replication factor A1
MQYNTCKSNFEITFDMNSEIHLADDAGDIQGNVYDFVQSIAHIESIEANKTIDVLAIVKSVGDPTTLMSKKTGNELTKADLVLVDDSGVEINMTLWGEEKANSAAQTYANNPVVAFRRARVSDFGGKSLSLSGGAYIRPTDALDRIKRLEDWWNNGGSSGAGTKSLSSSGTGGSVAPFHERLPISAVKEKHMGHGEKPDWLTFKGTISFIKKDKEGGAWYPACANAGDPCRNMYKMTQTTDGSWFCDKCQGTFAEPVRRWIFSGTVEDDTCSTWVSFFNPQAETLLGGATADQAYASFFSENHDQDGYDSLFYKAQHTEWVFKCKVKSEQVNEEQRVKTSVYALKPLDYEKECQDILSALEKM